MKPRRIVLLALLIPTLLVVALVVAACAGEETTTTTQAVTTTAAATATAAPTTTIAPPTTQAVTTTSPVTQTTGSATSPPAPTVAGTIAFERVVETGANADIYVVNTDGTGLRPLAETASWEEHPSWSPDGSRIAYSVYAEGSVEVGAANVWVMNADGSAKAQLTKWGGDFSPAWSPGGKQIVYCVTQGVQVDVFIMNTDGSGARNVTDSESVDLNPSWAPSGEILFVSDGDLYSINPDGSERVRLTTGKTIGDYALSPDGKTLAYHDHSKHTIVAVSLDGGGAPVTLLSPVTQFIKDDPEVALAWTADGRALAVASSDIMGLHGSPLYIINADGTRLSMIPGVDTAICPSWRAE